MLIASTMPSLRGLGAALAPHLNSLLSAIAAVCGIAGTALLALEPDRVLPVFALYLASSTAWMAVGYMTRQPWLMGSNVIYFALALKGLAF